METKVLSQKPLGNLTQFWEDLKAIAGPYWYPIDRKGRAFSEVIASWGMLSLLILLIIGLVASNAVNSFVNRYLVDVIIQDKDPSKFLNILLIYALTLFLITLFTAFSRFARKRIIINWYQYLNQQVLEKYLGNRAYYKINFRSDVDNPDQRLAQEIEPIARNAVNFAAIFLEKVLEMLTFLIILLSISKLAAAVLLIYTIIGNLIAAYLSQELDKITQEELVSKANYTYSLTHVRNHAESIAFFQGEKQELNIIMRRFNTVLKNSISKIDWEKNQDIFNRGYRSVIQIFPFVVFAPAYIRGEIDFGQVNQAIIACSMFANGFTELISEFGSSGRFSSYVARLSEFSQALEVVIQQPKQGSIIKTIENNHIAFEDMTLETPDYEKVIVENLSLSVEPGQGLLIVGPSGQGKSSLLRAIAGLWNSGKGRLIRPSLEEFLFLPQRPYIILGTLREQLLYPKTNNQMSDAELEAVLQQVNLQNVVTKVDSFDAVVPWENILSLGEQQRLAFARLIVSHPNYVILDEATSALDGENEERLYQQLHETKATFISVGHRESLFKYHQWVLELSQDSSWRLTSISDYVSPKK
uniref:McyH n=2 Tax=unclassified Phormidium TaxID=2609805 RepID=A0A5K6AYD4_9CYAN|nr:McyH [Phormidium sp. LP904e]QCQ67878.1 ABC transporter [Phormidium sp. LP904c]